MLEKIGLKVIILIKQKQILNTLVFVRQIPLVPLGYLSVIRPYIFEAMEGGQDPYKVRTPYLEGGQDPYKTPLGFFHNPKNKI